jgi:transcription factor STE12
VQQGILALGQSCPVRYLNCPPTKSTLLINSFRHRRTHEPRADGEPLSDYQEDELEGEDDHLHSLDDDLSPESGNEYLSGLSHSINDIPGPGLGMTMAPPQHGLMAGSHY